MSQNRKTVKKDYALAKGFTLETRATCYGETWDLEMRLWWDAVPARKGPLVKEEVIRLRRDDVQRRISMVIEYFNEHLA